MPKPTPDHTFDFQMNPEKTVSDRTLTDYQKRLQKITLASAEKHKESNTNPIIKTKDDLLNHSEYVVHLIQQLSDKRLALCAFYSAVFYAIGRQNYDEDTRGKIYLIEFRKVYYTDKYPPKESPEEPRES